jgi:hypothetical protein
VGNGIPKPNDLDYVKYYSNDDEKKITTTKLLDKEALKKMPKGNVTTFFLKVLLIWSSKQIERIDRERLHNFKWSAYADIYNDGDLDVINT